jgi:hypothetical protein
MGVNETATRHANRFLADLTQAMRSTAETARQATIEQCEADAKSYTEQLQARTDGEGASLRQAAEADVSAIRDWSTAEIERIGVETEQRIARRRELLEQELHEYASAIEVEIASIQKHVADYEAEVASFFERLLKEGDPSVFAGLAAQMPESPSFGEGEYGSISPHLPALSEEIVRSGAETAVEVSPETPPPVQDSPGVEVVDEVVDESAQAEARTPGKPASVDSTQVVVVGLVSVASIATFKRQLGRLPGVKNVGVSSGPDGEFIFTVSHGSDTSLASLIPTLPAFQARVVSELEGVINVSAHDPEAEG